MAKPIVREIIVRGALSRSGLPDLDYSLNPYIGCWHSCIYCYARLYTNHREVSENWGDVILVKKNLLEILQREVRSVRRGVVGIGTITDPYQPVEALYELTRRSIEILALNGFDISIQTKNTLILRDIDLLEKYIGSVDVGFTITLLDDNKAKIIEPRASPPTARASALKKLSSRGIDTWIFYGPVIPYFNDDDKTIISILTLAKESGSRVLVDRLHVKGFMFRVDHPLRRYALYAKRYDWKGFYERVGKLCGDIGVECIHGFAEPSRDHSRILTLDRYM